MKTWETPEFEGNEVAIQVIAKGSFVDSSDKDKPFIVETTTLRLNHVALSDYILSAHVNCRDVYADGEEGEQKWQEHKATQAEKCKVWETTIKDMLGATDNEGSFCITQSFAEVFTVVRIWKALGHCDED